MPARMLTAGLDQAWIAHLEAIPAASPSVLVKTLCTCYLALSVVLFRLSGILVSTTHSVQNIFYREHILSIENTFYL
jgi:hypothetical protein